MDVRRMNWLRRMMMGRYGNDQLGNFLFVIYLLFFVLQLIFRGSIAGLVLLMLGYFVIVLYFFRFFSINIFKRQLENQKFMQVWNSVKNFFRFWKMRWQERSGTKALYRCPKCHQVIRVPKGKGKIAITCPKCRFEFIKKT